MEKNGVPMPQILTWPPISGSIWAPERALGSRGYLVNPSGLGRVNSGIHNSVHIQLVLEARRSFNCLHKYISCPGSCWGDRSTSLKAQGERRPRSMLRGGGCGNENKREKVLVWTLNCAFARAQGSCWGLSAANGMGFARSPSQSAQQRMNERKPVTVGMTAKGCSARATASIHVNTARIYLQGPSFENITFQLTWRITCVNHFQVPTLQSAHAMVCLTNEKIQFSPQWDQEALFLSRNECTWPRDTGSGYPTFRVSTRTFIKKKTEQRKS